MTDASTFLADLESAERVRKGPRCTVWSAYRAIEDDELRVAVTVAIEESGKSARIVSTTLRKYGYCVPKESINRHRRGDCACTS